MNAYETAAILANMAKYGEDGTVDSSMSLTLAVVAEDLLPKHGFYVGGVRPSLVVSHSSEVDRGELAWFIGGTDARYFGVWTDTDDGKIYFDGVTYVRSESEALALGRERGEIAVWDIGNEREIRCQTAGDNS